MNNVMEGFWRERLPIKWWIILQTTSASHERNICSLPNPKTWWGKQFQIWKIWLLFIAYCNPWLGANTLYQHPIQWPYGITLFSHVGRLHEHGVCQTYSMGPPTIWNICILFVHWGWTWKLRWSYSWHYVQKIIIHHMNICKKHCSF